MKKFIAMMSVSIMLFCFAACTDGGNVDDTQSGGVISEVKSDVEDVVSKIGSDVSSMMD